MTESERIDILAKRLDVVEWESRCLKAIVMSLSADGHRLEEHIKTMVKDNSAVATMFLELDRRVASLRFMRWVQIVGLLALMVLEVLR